MKYCNICSHYCNKNTSKCGQNPLEDDEDIIKTSGIAVDPIEKKPLYHYMPGSKTLSIGSLGCNFKCLNCQNYQIAQPREYENIMTEIITPHEIIQQAIINNTPSISWTYNEASIHPKWIIKTAKLAQKHNIKTILVTNAYSSKETMKKLVKYVDAVNIDLKSMNPKFYEEICQAKLEPVLENIKDYHKKNAHTEITNLIIPGHNDRREDIKQISEFVYNLSPEMVLHFSAFYPTYKLSHLRPTSEKIILDACNMAKNYGLKYVYPGNTRPTPEDNTYCQKCGEILIQRLGYNTINNINEDNTCPKCNTENPIILQKIEN